MESGDTFGDYTLTRVVGKGSRARVWEARRDSTGEPFALKVLDTVAEMAPARLRAEYAAQGQLDHPNVVRVHDLIETEGSLALVMELAEGGDLSEYIESFPPTQEQALKVFAGILQGLAAAHDKGMVHRDLKPKNILMTSGPYSIPKITDFGIVKRKDKGALKLTQQGAVLGTLRYMSPEQLKDASGVDQRADLFSAGCILFELLTHERCFAASHRVALVNAVRMGDHTPYPEGFDPELQAVIEWMIASEPADRPASARDVLNRLGLPTEPSDDLRVPLFAGEPAGEGPNWQLVAAVAVPALLVVLVGLYLFLG